jgi:hypothetical protein
MAGDLNAIFYLAGTRLYTLAAYLGLCLVSEKSPREFAGGFRGNTAGAGCTAPTRESSFV